MRPAAEASLRSGRANWAPASAGRPSPRSERFPSSPRTEAPAEEPGREVDTPYGRATVSRRAPGPLFVHRMARTMWAPMLAMGPMVVVAGLVVSFAQAGESNPGTFADLGAWVEGL